MSLKSNHCVPCIDVSIIIEAIAKTQVLGLTHGDGKHEYQHALDSEILAP